MFSKEKKTKRTIRFIAGFILVSILFIIGGTVFLYTRSAQAQFGIPGVPQPTIVVEDVPAKVLNAINKAIKTAADVAFKNVLRQFLNKIAYDAAVYVASGGKGQKPLFLTNPGQLLEKTADNAYGEYLDNLSKQVWGKSLCDQPPFIKARLDVWARQVKDPKITQATCPVSAAVANIQRSTHEQLVDFSKKFNPQASEFGAYLSIISGAEQFSSKQVESTKFVKQLEGEFESVKSTITGAVKTPARTVGDALSSIVPESIKPYATYTGTAIADAIGVFTNTLTSKLIERIFKKGFNPEADTSFREFVGTSSSGVAAARTLFASLNQPDFNVGGSQDILNILASCPPTPAYNNCIIDEKFRIAIEQELTVGEALQQGLLDSSKIFGFDAQGREPTFRNGYPYRSLLVLRHYRIIPAGWELAAGYIQKFEPGNYTLGGLVAQYEQKEKSPGQPNPFYHLIDPNWVLKAPELFCRRQGAGEQVTNEQFSPTFNLDDPNNQISTRQVQRADYCADEQTCLFENEDGSCKRFGYCVEEKPIWRFQGTQCASQFSTCQAFQKQDGTSVAYVQNTIDYNSCNANNAGCQIYCTEFNTSTNQWQCDTGDNLSTGESNIISFNGQVQSCNATAAGCSEFIRTKDGLGTNILANGSFEKFSGTINDQTKDTVDQWGLADVSSEAFSGLAAAQIVPNDSIVSVPLATGFAVGGRTFTLSFHGKRISGDCSSGNTYSLETQGAPSPELSTSFTYFDSWTRYAGTITFPVGTPATNLVVRVGNNATCTSVVDAVQLEEGSQPSDYKDYGSVNKLYLNGQRISCSDEEVGCEQYTSVTTGESIPGKVTNPQICDPNDPSSCDQCPVQYLGCKAYREMPITNTPQRPGQDIISFIASTGQACPASAVGCEEYTNLDEVAGGGEGLEYYSLIRQCVKDDAPNIGTYYTWVGSDEFGYQLKKFELKKSNLGGAPCTNLGIDNPSLPGQYQWPNCVDGQTFDENGDGISETHDAATCPLNQVGVNPDCTQFYDDIGNTYTVLKSRIAYADANCHPYRNTIDGQAVTYHLIPGQGIQCSAQYAGCREYKGNAGTNIRTLISSDFESGSINPWASDAPGNLNPSTESVQVGGHSMLVLTTASTNVETLITQGKSYLISFWAKSDSADTIVRVGFTNPNIVFPGQAAVKVQDWNRYQMGPVFLNQPVTAGAKLSIFSAGDAFFVDNIIVQEVVDNIYMIKGSYQECAGYENCDAYRDRDNQTHYLKSFSNLCASDKVGCEAMIDTKNSSSAFSEQFTANPERGDMNGDGKYTFEDGEYIMNYIFNRDGPKPYPVLLADVNGSGTISLSDQIYLVNYINGNGPAPVPYNATKRTIPDDSYVYMVNDPAKYCDAQEKGCSRLGTVNFNLNNQVSGYADTYLINNPDTYGQTLCKSSEQSCAAFNTGSGTSYFKDPKRQCEYRDVGAGRTGWYRVGSASLTPDCPVATGFCFGGANAGAACDIDSDCGSNICKSSSEGLSQPTNGWVGICPAGQSGCQEYSDPTESLDASVGQCKVNLNTGTYETVCTAGDGAGTTNCDPSNPAPVCDPDADGVNGVCSVSAVSCKPYYYVNQSIDTSSCFGTVDPRIGCRLFYDSSQGAATYDSRATYTEVDRIKQPTAPVTCADPNNCDSNLIVKVRNDRECGKWLECATSTRVTNTRGEVEELCFDIKACNKIDPKTGACIGTRACSNDSTKSCTTNADCTGGGTCVELDIQNSNITPHASTNVDVIKNSSGIVKAGVNWGCSNDPAIVCKIDADCGLGNKCQIISGFYPVRAMTEIGLGGASDVDLVATGDMGDIDLNEGYKKTFPAGWERSGADLTRVIEEALDGTPDRAKIDENNVLVVDTNSTVAGEGVQYQLTGVGSAEYVVSLNARFDATPEPDDMIAVKLGYFNSLGVLIGSQLIGDRIQPTTSWAKFVFGPLTPNIPASTDSVKLQIVQESASGGDVQNGITFYLDNVSMKPTLEVQSDPPNPSNKLTRTCRMYPRSDSTLCRYIDSNGAEYKGWFGYCIEQDPKNPSQCITWWPVDIIAGESNVFGAGVKAGYADRAPLYMCVDSRGNYNRAGNKYIITANAYSMFYLDGDSCGNSSGVGSCGPTATDIYGRSYSYNCKVNGAGFTFGGCVRNASGGGQANYRYWNIPSAGQPEYGLFDYEIERVLGRKVSNRGEYPNSFVLTANDATTDPDPDFVGLQGNLPLNGSAWVFKCSHTDAVCGGQDLRVALVFDGQHRLIRYYVYLDDWTGSENEAGAFTLDFYLREQCEALAQVVKSGGDNVAWAGRSSSGSPYTAQDLQYNYLTDFAPFGGVLQPKPEGSTPDSWAVPVYAEQRQNPRDTSTARAGSAYACDNGNCSTRMCSNSSTNDCSDDNKINTCLKGQDGVVNTADDGYCIGLGPYPPGGTGGGVWASGKTIALGIDRLKRLFADVYVSWAWDYAQGKYVIQQPIINAWQASFDGMSECPGARPGYPNDYCGIRPQAGNLRIVAGGSSYKSGDITIQSGDTIQLTFTSTADREQLPLQRIRIDWQGNGFNTNPNDGDVDEPWGFAPKGDPANPHWYNHTYTSIDAATCPGTGCKPTIQLIDNWGWCSGGSGVDRRNVPDGVCTSVDTYPDDIIVQ